MLPKSNLYLKILMNRFKPGQGEAYLKPLPKNEAKEVLGFQTVSEDPSSILFWTKEEIFNTHYSWLVATLEKLPVDFQMLVMRALPKSQAIRLGEMLKIKVTPEPLTPPIQAFILNWFWKKWQEKPNLPKAYLAPSPLSPMLSLTKVELVDLIDFLAIYDLAESVRHIVDKKQIKSVLQSLSPAKQQFLRICLHQAEKVVAPKIEIDKWDGNAQKLDQILHRRGILRLSKALNGQNEDFIWHIVHTLDKGRGSIILKNYAPIETSGVTLLLVQQVLFAMNFLKKREEAA